MTVLEECQLTYRSICKDDILSSIREGISFIQNCQLGPITDQFFAQQHNKTLSLIDCAWSSEELLAAMKVSHANTYFALYTDVFRLATFSAFDGEVGFMRYSALAKWGAFAPMKIDFPERRLLVREICSYLLQRYLLIYQDACSIIDKISQASSKSMSVASISRNLVEIYAMYRSGLDSEVSTYLMAASEEVIENLMHTGRLVSSFGDDESICRVSSALEYYEVDVGSSEQTLSLRTITAPFYRQLERFGRTDEFCGSIYCRKVEGRYLLRFCCSHKAILSCAAAMRDRSFLNSSRVRI